jgi:DNA-binding NarL/FixJ family response regulator
MSGLPLRVLLADDHALVRMGVRAALEAADDIEVLGEASTAAQLIPLISRTSPDLVLLDMQLPDGDGLSLLAAIRERFPRVKVAMLSVTDNPRRIARALQAGACAYIVKGIHPDDLAAVVRQAVSASFYCVGTDLAVHERAGEAHGNGGLSDRELEILEGVAAGKSNREIAKELWLSDQTIKFHLHNIYGKLGVANRTEAARYAYESGLLEVLV